MSKASPECFGLCARWLRKTPELDNHSKIKLGVGLTIGSSIVAMLMMAHSYLQGPL